MRTYLLSFFICLFLISSSSQAQNLDVDQIMRHNWIGSFPSDVQWAHDSKSVYFQWNPDNNPADSLYQIAVSGTDAIAVSPAKRRELPPANGVYSKDYDRMIYGKNGNLFLLNTKSGSKKTIIKSTMRATSPHFVRNEAKVAFTLNQGVFTSDIATGELSQIVQFVKGKEKDDNDVPTKAHERWLYEDQLAWIEIVKKRNEENKLKKVRQEADRRDEPKKVYLAAKSLGYAYLSQDEKYVVYQLVESGDRDVAQVPNYVTESGFTENISTRPKVGSDLPKYELWVMDVYGDTTYQVAVENLPGIKDLPDYTKDYPNKTWEEKVRPVIFLQPKWSDDGQQVAIEIRSQDNKDRWFAGLDLAKGALQPLERQRDEAWIGGPGIGGYWSANNWGWMPNNQDIWFQSEATGFSHLYLLNTSSGTKRALTSGDFEVYNPQLSKDKKRWYFSSNEIHYGERHFYHLPIDGGMPIQITTLEGHVNVTVSPDEKYLAFLYSNATTPWELYIQENKKGAKPRKMTDSSTDEFKSYPWRTPEIIQFEASDGVSVPARLYRPENAVPDAPAVIFVHGAGYLQNAHKWWSSYFREYMFHNLLVERGFTVLDIDYRGSAGYGRDWRTAIYRHMGGKDLTDQVDGAKYLVEKHGIDAAKIGIYGGSYGGFITLMGMFQYPEIFTAGAALRSVTDWAHYNHGYTSNILNEPHLDSLSYARSSPIYYAEGLSGHLLIAHGMVDTNVHFQDVVRLAQRLIELRKENWEFAVYPVENHGFVEETSWADEYRRILKLFEERLK